METFSPAETAALAKYGDGESHAFKHKSIVAHGILMGLAFAIFFPLGALTIRLPSFRGLIWVHAGAQIFAYATALAALGLGVWIALFTDQLNAAHPIIGIVVIGLLFFQPVLGLIHHYIYIKEHKRTFWIRSHVWLGRTLLILGMINGGLGLQLSGNTIKGEIAYGVIAGVIGVFYIGVVLFVYLKRGSGKDGGETGEKIASGSENSREEMNKV